MRQEAPAPEGGRFFASGTDHWPPPPRASAAESTFLSRLCSAGPSTRYACPCMSVSAARVPLVDLGAQFESIRAEIMQAIEDAISSAELFLGPQTRAFEAEF